MGDDTLDAVKPDWKSGLLLEDVIGKKILFREGSHEDAAYFLHNFRDEGDYAYTPREYLRRTINAPAEKAHHGHADENAVLMLAKQQNILLHDGGYRDQAPNGKYRADIYHNRLVFREGQPGEEGSMYEFIHDDGTYRRVTTELLHFHTFGGIEYSRTRLNDPYRQMLWDRAITYLKEEGVFLVVDWTVSQADRWLSTVNLWHPGKVLEARDDYFVGQVQHIYRYPGDTQPFVNRKELALLIEFPGSGRRKGHEEIRRCYGESDMIYEADSRHALAGSMNVFVTVLTPFAVQDKAEDCAGRVTVASLSPENDQLAMTYRRPGRTIELAYKLDLNKGLLDTPHYPKYSWDESRLAYGSIETDADFAFVERDASGEGSYGFVNGAGIRLEDRDLYLTPVMSSYQFHTGTYLTAHHKWRAWTGPIG
ncbi:heparinase II/III family protein [Paenibacillus sp. CC-CFT747]|nr:heparinase II/III family protein [Paenibacillus sp. CC-CFT747]